MEIRIRFGSNVNNDFFSQKTEPQNEDKRQPNKKGKQHRGSIWLLEKCMN